MNSANGFPSKRYSTHPRCTPTGAEHRAFHNARQHRCYCRPSPQPQGSDVEHGSAAAAATKYRTSTKKKNGPRMSEEGIVTRAIEVVTTHLTARGQSGPHSHAQLQELALVPLMEAVPPGQRRLACGAASAKPHATAAESFLHCRRGRFSRGYACRKLPRRPHAKALTAQPPWRKKLLLQSSCTVA